MAAYQAEWQIPFSPSNDYLMPGERFGRAVFTRQDTADEFVALMAKHGWADRHGHRNAAKVGPVERVDAPAHEVLDEIPDWCFPRSR